jgi:hypothetical protein
MPGLTTQHPSAEQLEEYVLHRLSGESLDRVEEHLLLCSGCCRELEQVEQFIAAFKQAARRIETAKPPLRDAWWQNRRLWAPALATSLAGLLVLTVPQTWTTGNADSATVSLQASRGDLFGSAAAPAARPLVLEADLTELGAPSPLFWEIVDAKGTRLNAGTQPAGPSKLTIRHDRPLPAGQYWVRLYSGSADGPLLREYGIQVQ